MKTRRTTSVKIPRALNESQNSKLEKNLDMAFPGMLYDPKAIFDTMGVDFQLLFDAINDGAF